MEYYSNIVQWLYKLKVLKITKVYPKKELDFKPLLEEYGQLNVELKKLREEYKKSVMMSEKMKIDDELYEKEIKIKQIINKLK